MGITLIINPGSSSKKFFLYKDDVLLISAYVGSDGEGFNLCIFLKGIQQSRQSINRHRFQESLRDFLEYAEGLGIINGLAEIGTVAFRVVAPGTFFQAHSEITDEYIKKLQQAEAAAPLRIPHLLKEIIFVKEILPQARLIGASDSAFHITMPDYIREYSLPKEDVSKHEILRFGYHGLATASVIRRIHAVTGQEPARVVVCHIGSGVSVTAIKDGKCFDTSMGYGPSSGLIMGSRAGDVDTGALLRLMQIKNLKPIDANTYIQTQGGLFGLTGEIDLRILLERQMGGDAKAKKAISSFVYQIQKKIGGYMAIMGGLDLLVFTATAAERSPVLRSLITDELNGLGIKIDSEKNDLCVSKDGMISLSGAEVKVAVIKADEAGEILKISQVV